MREKKDFTAETRRTQRSQRAIWVVFIFMVVAAGGLCAAPGFYEPWGRDSDLRTPPPKVEPVKLSLATKVAHRIIRFHQEVISPVDGPRSHYRPSSSQYMKQAMTNYGFFRGFIMGCDRLLRENDEEWVYRKIEVNGEIFKYDPAIANKYE